MNAGNSNKGRTHLGSIVATPKEPHDDLDDIIGDEECNGDHADLFHESKVADDDYDDLIGDEECEGDREHLLFAPSENEHEETDSYGNVSFEHTSLAGNAEHNEDSESMSPADESAEHCLDFDLDDGLNAIAEDAGVVEELQLGETLNEFYRENETPSFVAAPMVPEDPEHPDPLYEPTSPTKQPPSPAPPDPFNEPAPSGPPSPTVPTTLAELPAVSRPEQCDALVATPVGPEDPDHQKPTSPACNTNGRAACRT